MLIFFQDFYKGDELVMKCQFLDQCCRMCGEEKERKTETEVDGQLL